MNQHVQILPSQIERLNSFSSADFARMLELGAFEDMRVEPVRGTLEKRAPAYGGHGQQNFQIGMRIAQAFESRSVAIATDLAVRIARSSSA